MSIRVLRLLAVVGSMAVAAAAAGAQVHSTEGTVRVGARRRSYLIDVPPLGRATPVPLVVIFHGGGGSAWTARQQTRMSDLAASKHFIAVYPNGSGPLGDRLLTWNTGSCCGYAQRNDMDDVAFIRALLDSLERTYPIDRQRMYATGLSNGGMMSYLVGCAISDRFAAIAVVSGELSMPCGPTHPVSVLIIHGTADENLPYKGGVGRKALDKHDVKPVQFAVDSWLQFDECDDVARVDSSAGVEHRVWAPCNDRTAVELYTIVGGGHGWPGGERMSRAALNASSVIWDFFAAHPKREGR